MTSVLRRLLVAVPLGLAIALWRHPPGGTEIYVDVKEPPRTPSAAPEPAGS